MPGAGLVVGRKKTHKRLCSVVSSGSSHEDGSVSLCRATSLKFGCCPQLAHGAFPETSQDIWDPGHWPGQGVCKGALKWLDTKKATLCRNVLLLQHQSQCCDFPATKKPWGLWFTFSSLRLDFAASLMDRGCPARLVPYCNQNQTQPCSDTDQVSPQQTRGMDQEKLPGFAAACVRAGPPVSTMQIYRENFLNMWACLVQVSIQQTIRTFLCLLLKTVTIEVSCW